MLAAVLEGVVEVVANIASMFMGALPERQPWRTVVALFYLVAAVAAVAFIVWLAIDAL